MPGIDPHSAQRVFFALFPPADVAQAIAERAARYKLDGQPVAPQRLHMTLAFYGRRDPLALEDLAYRAAGVAAPPFSIRLDYLSHFRRAGATWLGPAATPAALANLATRLMFSDLLASRSVSQPHITVRRHAGPITPCPIRAISWPVTEFCLVASGTQGAPGAYRILERWALEG